MEAAIPPLFVFHGAAILALPSTNCNWEVAFGFLSLSLFLAVLYCKLRMFVAQNLISSFHARAFGTTINGEAVVAQGVGRGGAYYFVAWKRSLDSGGYPHGAPASTKEKSSSFWIHYLRDCECDQQHRWKFLEAN